ncbi:MAG TPA: type IV conjugative transfer system protein TraE [Burkholderiaceae bacterium]|nr:type IV conjugative transfer system protein TraE [Burkholderiaceae bacterium]
MLFKTQQSDLRTLKQSIAKLTAVALLNGLSILTLAYGVLSQMGNERTYFVPPHISKAFWMQGTQASPEYYEQMAGFVAWLILDVSPGSIAWKRNSLMAWVHPDHSGRMKIKMDLEEERLRKNNASTSFEILQSSVDAKAQTVMLTGQLRRQVNGVDVGAAIPRSYMAEFLHTGGRVHLKWFDEVPNDSFEKARESVAAARAADR